MLRIRTIIALAIGALGCRSFHPGTSYWSPQEMEALIRAEVPPGSGRDQVVGFANRHGMHRFTEGSTLVARTEWLHAWHRWNLWVLATQAEFFFGEDNTMDRFAVSEMHRVLMD